MLLVAPRWPRRLWYKAAENIAVAKLVYPANTHFFKHPHKKNRTSLWPVTVFLLCGHPEKCPLEHMQALHPLHVPQPRFGAVTHHFPTERRRNKAEVMVKPQLEKVKEEKESKTVKKENTKMKTEDKKPEIEEPLEDASATMTLDEEVEMLVEKEKAKMAKMSKLSSASGVECK